MNGQSFVLFPCFSFPPPLPFLFFPFLSSPPLSSPSLRNPFFSLGFCSFLPVGFSAYEIVSCTSNHRYFLELNMPFAAMYSVFLCGPTEQIEATCCSLSFQAESEEESPCSLLSQEQSAMSDEGSHNENHGGLCWNLEQALMFYLEGARPGQVPTVYHRVIVKGCQVGPEIGSTSESSSPSVCIYFVCQTPADAENYRPSSCPKISGGSQWLQDSLQMLPLHPCQFPTCCPAISHNEGKWDHSKCKSVSSIQQVFKKFV